MLVAALFLFGIVGPGIAQQAAPEKAPIATGEAKPAGPIKGEKSKTSKDAQKMTPAKEKASKAPPIAAGEAKPAGPIKGEKSKTSKDAQKMTPEKKKMYDTPKSTTGESASPKN